MVQGTHLHGRRYAFLGVLALLLILGCEWCASPPLVGVIFWGTEIPVFLENWQGVMEGLREEGYQEGVNIRLQVANVMGNRREAATAARQFREKGAALVITVGTIPTLVAREILKDNSIPLVYSMVAAPAENGLRWSPEAGKTHFTGTSSEVPAKEQFHFLLQAKPGMRRLGILHCAATPQAEATAREAVRAAKEMGLAVCWEVIPDDRPQVLERALDHLSAQGVEAVFLPTDPVLLAGNNLRVICETLASKKVPVMVPSGSSVAAGALLSYHADYVDLGRQAGRQAARVLRGQHPAAVTPESPRVKRLTINLQAARLLGLHLPWQLLSRAYDLHY